jgi:hypothetical protein
LTADQEGHGQFSRTGIRRDFVSSWFSGLAFRSYPSEQTLECKAHNVSVMAISLAVPKKDHMSVLPKTNVSFARMIIACLSQHRPDKIALRISCDQSGICFPQKRKPAKEKRMPTRRTLVCFRRRVEDGPGISSAGQRTRLTNLLLVLAVLLIVGSFAGGILLFRHNSLTPSRAQGIQWCPVAEVRHWTTIDAFTVLSPNDAWLVGETPETPSAFAHWDGHHWQTVAGDGVASVSLSALQALASDDIWAAGTRTVDNAGGSSPSQVAYLEHWDGNRWQAVDSPNLTTRFSSSFSGLSATAPDDVWVMGASSTAATASLQTPMGTGLLAHWDGSSWKLISLPETLQHSFFLSIAALATDDLWVLAGQGSASGTILAHWDGASWQREEVATAIGTGIMLSTLRGLAPDDLWGAGTFYDAVRNVSRPILVHWDGTQWTHVLPPAPQEDESGLQALQIVEKQDIWAAGTTGTNGIFVEHTERTDWHMLSVPTVPEAHPINVTIFGASQNKVWVVEQAFVSEHASDPSMETTCLAP